MYSDFVANLLKIVANHVNEKVGVEQSRAQAFFGISASRFFSNCELLANWRVNRHPELSSTLSSKNRCC